MHRSTSWLQAIIVALVTLFVIVACKKKEQPEQKTTPPTMTIADTLTSMPMDTAMAMEDIKPEVVSSPDGKFTVQVSSWRTRRKAEKVAQRFLDKGYEAYIQEAFLPDRRETWYRVRIGRYVSGDAAMRVANEIRDLLESGYWIDRLK